MSVERDEELEKILRRKLMKMMKSSKSSGEVLNLNSRNFYDIIAKTDKPVLVDFWAEWCPPCKVMAPIVEELAKDYAEKAVIAKVNVDENPRIAAEYNIMAIPTFIIFKGGKPVERLIGAVGRKPLEEALKKYLG